MPVDDPVTAVATLLAARLAGAVPVLAAASWPRDGLGRALALAGATEPDRPDDLLVVVTSGSSGSPRAVVRTAASWQVSFAAFDTLLAPDGLPGDVVWVPGGADSTLTLFGLWHALATGRPVVAPGRWRGAASAAAGAAARAVHCVPAVLPDLLDAVGAGRLPALRRAVVAGSALPATLRRAAADRGVEVVEYYGAAELSFVAADLDGTGLRAFPGVELTLRDGLVWSRSPYQALGYLDPAAGGPLRRDEDGWACVGDLGTLDGAVLTVRGRGEQAASVGGRVVVLDDVERALAGTAGLAEVVCLAEPDPKLGERVLCVARPLRPGPPGATAPADRLVARLRDAARATLPAHARPIRYVVRDELPRTPGGKIARAGLRKELGLP